MGRLVDRRRPKGLGDADATCSRAPRRVLPAGSRQPALVRARARQAAGSPGRPLVTTRAGAQEP